MTDCYCDYDAPEFNSTHIRTARKKHRCGECGVDILPGEKYEHVFGKWDGSVATFKTCEHCHDLRMWTLNNIPCFCWSYGNLHEDAMNAIEYARQSSPEETAGLMFGILRRLVIIRRQRNAKI